MKDADFYNRMNDYMDASIRLKEDLSSNELEEDLSSNEPKKTMS